jgi:hypothetical protein
MSKADQRKVGALVREQITAFHVTRFSAGRIALATGVSVDEVARFFLNQHRYFTTTVSTSCPECSQTLATSKEPSQPQRRLYCPACAKSVEITDEDSIVYFDVLESRRDSFLKKSNRVPEKMDDLAPVRRKPEAQIDMFSETQPQRRFPSELTFARFEEIRLKYARRALVLTGGFISFAIVSVAIAKMLWGVTGKFAAFSIGVATLAVFLILRLVNVDQVLQGLKCIVPAWGKGKANDPS